MRVHPRSTEHAAALAELQPVLGLIAAVGIITNSQILIVAAMVVGPEYGAITSVALDIDRGHGTRIRQGLFALSVGFPLAVLVSFLFSWVIRGLDLQPEAFDLGIRPVSTLIDAPNFFSVVVAVLAGIVGIMSLTQARTSALLGVFISVTTIPAAADIGVSCAFSPAAAGARTAGDATVLGCGEGGRGSRPADLHLLSSGDGLMSSGQSGRSRFFSAAEFRSPRVLT